jgi:hypothetical protein
LELGVHPTPDEDIRGKQRQTESLGSVLPPVGDGIQWEKHFMTFARKDPGNWFLMLMPCVKYMPVAQVDGSLSFLFIPHQWHAASPCDLHGRLVQIASPQSLDAATISSTPSMAAFPLRNFPGGFFHFHSAHFDANALNMRILQKPG